MFRAVIVAMALAFTVVPASATSCIYDMPKIDAALKTAKLSPSDRAAVVKYRRTGERLHKSGRHREASEMFGRAKNILGGR
jgi:hypothetical protein